MLSMRVDTMINALVSHLVEEGSSKNEALHFHLDLRMATYIGDGNRRFSASRGLHLLYYREANSAYVHVFSAVLDSPFATIASVTEWKHECTHDSCWRDVGVFAQVYFGMANEINDARADAKLEAIAPKDMSEHNGFAMFGKPFTWRKVKVMKDETDDNSYRRKVVVE